MKSHPLIKAVLLLISGILVQHYFNLSLIILTFTAAAVSAATAGIIILKADCRLILTLTAATGIINTGAFLYKSALDGQNPYPFTCPIIRETVLSGRVESIDLNNENDFRFIADADTIRISGHAFPAAMKVLVKVKSTEKKSLELFYESMRQGDYISISGTLMEPREERNPGEFNYKKYLLRKGISSLFISSYPETARILKAPGTSTASAVFNIRKAIDLRIKQLTDTGTAALLRGLLLADRGGITDDIEEDFINTGVVHILAVSGSNVLLIILLLSVFTGRLGLYTRTIFLTAGIFAFLLLTGTGPSVTRAVITSSVIMAAFLMNRSINPYNAAALSALTILLLNPFELFDPGFQLSYAAVVSIIFVHPRLMNLIDRYLPKRNGAARGIIYFLTVTMAAQAGTMPITLYYFGKLSVVAPFANLLIIPLTGVLTAAGAAAILISTVSLKGAMFYGEACNLLARISVSLTHLMSGFSFSFINISGFGAGAAVIFYTGIGCFFLFLNWFQGVLKKAVIALFLAAVVLIFIDTGRKELMQDGKLSVIAIDVGQGDATLVKTPGGIIILIDAGKADLMFDYGYRVIMPFLSKGGIDKIDLAIITHIDSDHYSGFVSLIRKGMIKNIIKPAADTADRKDKNFEIYALNSGATIKYFKEQIITIDNIKIYMLFKDYWNNFNKLTKNDRSGIIKIVYGETSFLFTGDAGVREERLLADNYGKLLSTDVLKLGHHGSSSSSSDEFLKAASPKFGLISAGLMNRYGHPSPSVLIKLKQLKIVPLRTDLNGAVLFESDGSQISVKAWRHEEK